jgi:hypothetical protein
VGPRRDEGSQSRRFQAAGSHDHAGHEECYFWWHRGFSGWQKGAQDGLSLLECPINAPRRAGGRHCRH